MHRACSSGRSSRWTVTSTSCALYVDPEEPGSTPTATRSVAARPPRTLNNAAIRQSTSTGAAIHPDQIESRTALRVRSGEQLSFGTYFNAFPASYWRRWTIVDDVTLTVEVAGSRRDRHRLQVDGQAATRSGWRPSRPTDAERARFSFELPLKPFIDGGWYWYDVVAGDDDVVVSIGRVDRRGPGRPRRARHRRHRRSPR